MQVKHRAKNETEAMFGSYWNDETGGGHKINIMPEKRNNESHDVSLETNAESTNEAKLRSEVNGLILDC